MIYSGILINCGGEGDDGFDGGAIVNRGAIKITGTDRPNLFRTERYGVKSYLVEVADGTYDVHLGFAETYSGISKIGGRVFHVAVNGGQPVEVDVYKEAGGRNKAIVRSFRGVEAKDGGGIDVRFVGPWPIINYIEVVRAGTLGEADAPLPQDPPPPPGLPSPPPPGGLRPPPEAARRGMTRLLWDANVGDKAKFAFSGRLGEGQTLTQLSQGNIFSANAQDPGCFVHGDGTLTIRNLKSNNYQAHVISYDPWTKRGFLLPAGGGWYAEAEVRFLSPWKGWPGGFAFWSMDWRHLYGGLNEGSFIEPDFYEVGNGSEWCCIHHWDRAGGGKKATPSVQNIRGPRQDYQQWFKTAAFCEPNLSAFRWVFNDQIIYSSSPSWMNKFATFRGPVMLGSGPNLPLQVRSIRVWGR